MARQDLHRSSLHLSNMCGQRRQTKKIETGSDVCDRKLCVFQMHDEAKAAATDAVQI